MATMTIPLTKVASTFTNNYLHAIPEDNTWAWLQPSRPSNVRRSKLDRPTLVKAYFALLPCQHPQDILQVLYWSIAYCEGTQVLSLEHKDVLACALVDIPPSHGFSIHDQVTACRSFTVRDQIDPLGRWKSGENWCTRRLSVVDWTVLFDPSPGQHTDSCTGRKAE